jgi:CRP-like cAMP-binding protein
MLDGTESVYPSRNLGSGSVLGLPATLSGEKYSLTAEVTADSRFAFVPRQAVLNLLSRNSDLSLQVMHLLSGEISSMRETMAAHL